MKPVVNKSPSSQFIPDGTSTSAGQVSYQNGMSTKTKIEDSFIFLNGSTFMASNCVNSSGTIVQATGTLTYNASSIQKSKIENKIPCSDSDVMSGTVIGIRTSDGSPASFNATFKVADAGQTTVTMK